MTQRTFNAWRPHLIVAVLGILALGACSALRSPTVEHPSFYSLDMPPGVTRAAIAAATAPTLLINPPHAAAGYDSQRILYVRETHKLEYFAHSEWVDPPARMLAPLLVAVLGNSGAFRAVALTPTGASGELRLDTELVRLQHEFDSQPSRVRFTLRAYLIEDKTRRVLAWREFDVSTPAASENPYGGVVAANAAVREALARLSEFCVEVVSAMPLEKQGK
jgi:cholesterol transport system auxiliary component